MRHLCRRRWLEILTARGSFDALDGDGDGAVSAADVRDALLAHTDSLSVDQEAEAMVRSFDGDGDGALCARDVDELMEHFSGGGSSVRSASRRIGAKTQAEETARFDALAADGVEAGGRRRGRGEGGEGAKARSAGFREVAGRGGAGSRDPREARRRALKKERCANSAGGGGEWGVGTVRVWGDVVYNRCLIE